MRTMITLMALGLLAGCNTMHGFGQDMQNAGSDISSKAKPQPPPSPPHEVMSYPPPGPDAPPHGP
jgi:predicted small secreted protein